MPKPDDYWSSPPPEFRYVLFDRTDPAEDLKREAGYFRQHQQRTNYLEMSEEASVIGSGTLALRASASVVEGGASAIRPTCVDQACAGASKAPELDPCAYGHSQRTL